MVRVIIKNADNHQIERDVKGDYSDHAFRIWISKATMWAVNNNHYIMIGPFDD